MTSINLQGERSVDTPESNDPALASDELRPIHAIVRERGPRRAGIYWFDLFATLAIAFPCTAIYLWAPQIGVSPWIAALAALVGGLALFRSGTFIHEIQHFRKGEMRAFTVVWNLVSGIPFLMPSSMYENHADHHSTRHYGTSDDGEYLAIGVGPLRRLVFYILQVPLLPFLAVIRHGVLVPLSFLHPKLRTLLIERASSYGINFAYRRRIPANSPRAVWALADLACFAWVAGIGTLLVTGVLPWTWLLRLYVFVCFTIGLNWTRNLAAHQYRHEGDAMSRQEQLADSITIDGNPLLTELLFPIGLRYHSLHHLFPTIPYHELGKIHRRLLRELPADSLYRTTVYPSFLTVARNLVASAAGRDRSLTLHPAR